ncbi:MAG: hypothetical protein U1E05_20250 [Patescibacteria group bacterium]|nr:hypothetical protein [Patescibacteria group bacterium]
MPLDGNRQIPPKAGRRMRGRDGSGTVIANGAGQRPRIPPVLAPFASCVARPAAAVGPWRVPPFVLPCRNGTPVALRAVGAGRAPIARIAMLTNLFSSTTIPVLEEVAKFSQQRHTTLAGNIANLDTPGYKFRDLSVDDFQSRLQNAVEARRKPPNPYFPERQSGSDEAFHAAVSDKPHTILYHDKSNVELEQQVAETVKNHMQHNLALSIMRQQFGLLSTAISLRV